MNTHVSFINRLKKSVPKSTQGENTMYAPKFTQKNFRTLVNHFLLASLALLILLSSVVPPASAASGSNDWIFRLTEVRIKNADEDGFGGNGDEPYFIVLCFRSTFGKKGSTQVYWGHHLYEVLDGADDGDRAFIDNQMGTCHFPNVNILSMKQFVKGKLPEILGVITFAMESDATPFGDVQGMMDKVSKILNGQLVQLIENQGLNPLASQKVFEQTVGASLEKVKSSAIPNGLDLLILGLKSFADPDDLVGYLPTIFLAVDNSFQLQNNGFASRLTEQSYVIGNNPIMFQDDGSTYEVTARLDNIQFYGVNILAAHSNKCLDINANQWTENGGKLQQWDCLGSKQPNQRFTLIPDGNGYYQIAGTFDNKFFCLSTIKDSGKNGDGVHQWQCRGLGKKNQLWQLKSVGNGLYQIINKNSGKCLDVAYDNQAYVYSNGARFQQYDCLGSKQYNQLFYFANP